MFLPRAFIPVFNYRGPVYLSKQDKRANAITTNEELYSYSPSYSSDNKISELMVTELGGKGGIAFRLLPLQRVLLQVSSDEYLSHRELNLKFVSTSSASSMVSKTARVDDFIQEVIQEKINGVESLSSVSLRGTRDAFPSSEDVSLYNMIRSASTNPAQAPMGRQVSILSHRLSNVWYKCSGESPSTNTTLSIAKHQQIEKTYKKKPCSTLCHHIRGSGRFSYGPVDRTKSIYLGKGDALEYEAKLKLNADRVKLQLKSGHAAAQVRMDGWGEEWAEEEDLLSYSEGGVSSSSAPLAAGIMSKSLAKEVSISSQRIAKLKVAKKNSKYS